MTLKELVLNDVVFTQIDKITANITDSFVHTQNKLFTNREKPSNGETRLYIGSEASIKQRDFFPDFNNEVNYFKRDREALPPDICLFSKENLMDYISKARKECFFPTQNYFYDPSVNYSRKYNYITNLSHDYIFFTLFHHDGKNDFDRFYVNASHRIWTMFRKIALPRISYVNIYKMSNKEKKIIYYFEMNFRKTYAGRFPDQQVIKVENNFKKDAAAKSSNDSNGLNEKLNTITEKKNVQISFNNKFEDVDFTYKSIDDAKHHKKLTLTNPYVFKNSMLEKVDKSFKHFCILCDRKVKITTFDGGNSKKLNAYHCMTCGYYEISKQASKELETDFNSEYAKISALIREREIQGLLPLKIISDEELSSGNFKGDFITIKDIIKSFPTSVYERGIRTLLNLISLSKYPAHKLSINTDMYPIFFVETSQCIEDQLEFIVSHLVDKGYLKATYLNKSPSFLTITPSGWELAEKEKKDYYYQKNTIDDEREKVKRMNNRIKPAVFIGSSGEQLNVAYALQTSLESCSEPTVWDQGIFKLSKTTIENLIDSLNNFDFAVFIFAPDDITEIRNEEMNTVRDNVIFELGLFIGKIGIERTYFVVPNKTEKLHLPSDLLGVTYGGYNSERQDGNLIAALGPVSHKIKSLITQLGVI